MIQHDPAGGLSSRVVVCVGRIDKCRLEQQRAEDIVERVDAAQAHRPESVTVVAAANGDEPLAPRLADVAEVLVGDLGGYLHRRSTAVAVKNFRQPPRRRSHQALGQLDAGRAGVAQERRVRDPCQLAGNGRVDDWGAMPVQVAPEAGESVDVSPSGLVDQLEALGGDDHPAWLVPFLHPLSHGREGMPDERIVHLHKACGGGIILH